MLDPSTQGAKATVQGNVILAGSVHENITVNGTVTEASTETVLDEIKKRLDTAEPPLPATPTFFPSPAVKLQGNVISESEKTYYTDTVDSGLTVKDLKISTLTLKIPSTGLLSIAVTKLDLGEKTTITIDGTGVVMIYVRDTVYANQLTINMNKDTRLLIYSDTDKGKIDFKNGLTVNGGGLYIYTPRKEVNIENTSSANGAIVAREIELKNNFNFFASPPFPVEFDPTASNAPYYGLYVRYGGWSQ